MQCMVRYSRILDLNFIYPKKSIIVITKKRQRDSIEWALFVLKLAVESYSL